MREWHERWTHWRRVRAVLRLIVDYKDPLVNGYTMDEYCDAIDAFNKRAMRYGWAVMMGKPPRGAPPSPPE